jgi:hypothetical protein
MYRGAFAYLGECRKKERDEKGLNRFRLVLVFDDPEKVRPGAERQFEELRGSDEKVHLHVISRKDFPLTHRS